MYPPNYLHKNTVEQEAKVEIQKNNNKKNNNSQEKKENLQKVVILCKLIIRDTGINRPFLQNSQEKNSQVVNDDDLPFFPSHSLNNKYF